MTTRFFLLIEELIILTKDPFMPRLSNPWLIKCALATMIESDGVTAIFFDFHGDMAMRIQRFGVVYLLLADTLTKSVLFKLISFEYFLYYKDVYYCSCYFKYNFNYKLQTKNTN